MPTFLVAYDLNSPGQNYADLSEAIKNLGSKWWHHLDSTWLVQTSLSAGQVRDNLKAYLDIHDELLIVDVTNRARAWTGFNERGSRWLRENV